MSRSLRLAAFGLALVVLVAGSAEARAQTVVREPFNGTGPSLPPRWRDVDGEWRRASGSARIKPATVSAVTNLAYAVRRLRTTYAKRGLMITSRIRLSPGYTNVGLVGPFRDTKNHLFCKVEKTRAHPSGLLSIGRRRFGHQPTLLTQQEGLGLVAGQTYTMRVRRVGADATCALMRVGTRVGRVTYSMTARDRAAFGSGRKIGIRMRLVARGNRRDEDDGRSAFDSFIARTLS